MISVVVKIRNINSYILRSVYFCQWLVWCSKCVCQFFCKHKFNQKNPRKRKICPKFKISFLLQCEISAKFCSRKIPAISQQKPPFCVLKVVTKSFVKMWENPIFFFSFDFFNLWLTIFVNLLVIAINNTR